MSLGPLTVLRRVGTPRGVNRCTRVRIVFHSACTSTRQDQDSARVSAQVSVPVGHFIGDGPGACPVASIGLQSFRVYRGVSGPLTILGVTDLAGCLLCPHNGTVARIVLHGVRGVATSCRSLNYLKLPSWILGGSATLRFAPG